MLQYIVKRVLIIVFTLMVISLITFVLSSNTPGDPVESILAWGDTGSGQLIQKASSEKAYLDLKRHLGLDLPTFYFTITNATYPDTLYRVPKNSHRHTLERMAWEYGDWDQVAAFYDFLKRFELELYATSPSKEEAAIYRKLKGQVNTLFIQFEETKIRRRFKELDLLIGTLSDSRASLQAALELVQQQHTRVILQQQIGWRYVPKLNWYGIHNQYHNWFFGDKPWFGKEDPRKYYRSSGFLRGDFGISYADNRPVSSVVWEAIQWTFLLSFLAIFFTYLLAIPLGVKAASTKGTGTEKVISTGLFMLYSLPSFWVATMLITFLCNPDFLNWFPAAFSLMDIPEDAPFMYRFTETAYYLVLPLACWTYGSLAYLSRQMRGGMLSVLGMDFIRTARAKGVPENRVIWKHAFRNSLIPVITLFASIFPLAISGSIVLEIIFSIPGMGKISYEALIQRNYPIIYTVMMFTAMLTLVGTLVADIMYALVDPRISFTRSKS